MNVTFSRTLMWVLLASLLPVGGAAGQDLEMLGRFHGTRPPQAYYDLKAKDPLAFQFNRAFFGLTLKGGDLPGLRIRGPMTEDEVASALIRMTAEGPRASAVTGTIDFPLILGLYSDTPDPPLGLTRADVQAEYFDGPQANPGAVGTIPDFYGEISRNLITMGGTTYDWQQTGLTGAQVAGGEAGTGDESRTSEYIVNILEALDDGSVDWSQFDNDGDGYVDVLAVMHPTQGAECGGGSDEERYNRVWSHRWALRYAAHWQGSSWADPSRASTVVSDGGYMTSTPAPGGGFIKIDDYIIQGVVDCSTLNPNTIGVVAHELGHAFGLPDLYNTGDTYSHSGIGSWGLMGSGSWGCDSRTPGRPCHMSAWSKEALGWADVEVLAPGTDPANLVLPPVENTGKVYRIDAGDGSDEYLLLENRQRISFDANLYEPGLLIWHVDPAVVARRYGVNADRYHLGVWLRQGDGLNELAQNNGGRGDDGDPFPGSSMNTAFHAGSNPAALTHPGGAFGATLTGIEQVGSDMSFMAYAGYRTLTLQVQGVTDGTGLISVDGTAAPSGVWAYPSAPYQTHTISAAAGKETEPGVRLPFQGWTDGAPRVREYTTSMDDATLTATYGGREVQVDVELTSPVPDQVPGTIEFTPGDAEGWVPEGQEVAVTAVPTTGFGFLEWTGALAGQSNPATVTANGPVEAGATFEVTFSAQANQTEFQVPAATRASIQLVTENANTPVTWSIASGSVPDLMVFYTTGLIAGSPMVRGTFPLDLHVHDALGLEDELSVTLEVVDPPYTLEVLASPFLLSGTVLTSNERIYLDNEGNRNGLYDLGDLRAYWLRNPGMTVSGPVGDLLGGPIRGNPPTPGPDHGPGDQDGKEEGS